MTFKIKIWSTQSNWVCPTCFLHEVELQFTMFMFSSPVYRNPIVITLREDLDFLWISRFELLTCIPLPQTLMLQGSRGERMSSAQQKWADDTWMIYQRVCLFIGALFGLLIGPRSRRLLSVLAAVTCSTYRPLVELMTGFLAYPPPGGAAEYQSRGRITWPRIYLLANLDH